MKHPHRLFLAFVMAIAVAIAPTLPLWSQSPQPTIPAAATSTGKSGTYATIPCATLTAAPATSSPSGQASSPFPAQTVEGKDYECGYLTVPEQHSQPQGNTIQVGIVRLKSTNPKPAEPLLLFQGGPGGSSIDLFPGFFLPHSENSLKLLSERDLIVFEKRGNRYSKPYLDCPEYKEDDIHLDAAALAETLKGLKVCRDRLVNAGVNLAAFNSVESAHDVAALVQALGYKQVNLYGVSYGTELAQDVLRLHPDIVRSVILDGVVPNEPSVDAQYAVILDRLITEVDAACAQDADCHARYPDVKGTFEATYKRLNQTPGSTRLATGQGIEQQPVTGLNMAHTIFNLSYGSGAPFIIPALIYQASEGNFTMITHARYLSHSGGVAAGTYYSVKCSEDIAYSKALVTAGVAPFAKEWGGMMLNFMQDACQVWNVPAVPAAMRNAVVSKTPALVLNGQFDPITPPPFGARVARGFQTSTNVIFPDRGHGAIGSLCTTSLMAAFVAQPTKPLDTRCASEGKIKFITEKNTLMAPGTIWLTRSLAELNFFPLIQRVILLVLLILFPLVWLVLWFIGRARHQASEQAQPAVSRAAASRGARLAPWLGVLLALLSVLWIGLQLFGMESSVFLNTPNFFLGFYRLSVGIDRSFAWIYCVPIAIALASLGMAWVAVIAWKNHYWDQRRRYYYAFTAGVAIAYTGFLALAGQLTVFFG